MGKDFYLIFEEVCADTCGQVLPINAIRLEHGGAQISILHIVDDEGPPLLTVDGDTVREIGVHYDVADLSPLEIN